MTSFANPTPALAPNLPPPSSSQSPGPSTSNNTPKENKKDAFSMTHILCNLLENINKPSAVQSGGSAPPAMPYNMWASPLTGKPNPVGPIGREYHSSNSNNQHQPNHKSSDSPGPSYQPSGSPATSSYQPSISPGTSYHPSVSPGSSYQQSGSPGICYQQSSSPGSYATLACVRCEERMPTIRCQECNDIFCHECCNKHTSICQLKDHTLHPIQQISPIGARTNQTGDKEAVFCDLHGDEIQYFCEPCYVFICAECTLWVHKDHSHKSINGSIDFNRRGIINMIEDAKVGCKAIKAAIDRGLSMEKAYEKETAEVNLKIKKAMRCFAQAIEDRERYLLDKVEKVRQAKLNELGDNMNKLRGILAGLAHTNDHLLRSMNFEGVELLMARHKGRGQVDYYSNMFKTLYVAEEKVLFIPPNYDLLDQLKRQCDVKVGTLNALAASTSYHSLLALASASTYPAITYHHTSAPSSIRSIPQYSPPRAIKYHEHNNVTPNMPPEVPIQRGMGQAIPGYATNVIVKPTRSNISGVPMFSFAREGQEPGQVSRPWGLCIDKEGNIIVADRRNNRIQIFSSRGEFKTMFGSKGIEAGEFDLPAGITTDIFGRIIVIDKDNHRVQIFTGTGRYLLKFGSFGKENGQFQYPWDVAVNTVGNIVVTDTRNHRVQLFTSKGGFLTKFVFDAPNPHRLLKGPTTPRGVCFTATGNIIVSDFENHRLIVVDHNFSHVINIVGYEGSGEGELNRPSGIIVDDDGRIIVADSKNHRVVVFTGDLRVMAAVDLKSPGLDDKDRPSDVALTPEGYLCVLFETLPDTARDYTSHGKQYIKVY